MYLNDIEIKNRCVVTEMDSKDYQMKYTDMPMIHPYVPNKVNKAFIDGNHYPVISYGQSSAGYDIRLSDILLVPNPNYVLTPHNVSDDTKGEMYNEVRIENEPYIIQPNHMVLGVSFEHFNIPNDIIGIAVGKSSYARCGVIINITPLEPGWSGWLTVEIHNSSSNPVGIYPFQGIAQILFAQINEPENKYGNGKYQNQSYKPTAAKV